MEVLFEYPNSFNDDISVWKDDRYNMENYHIGIEGYIGYDNLQDGIDYLCKLKEKYFDWLKQNYDISELNNNIKNDMVYKSYDIEIFNHSNEEYKILFIFLSAPTFYNIYDTYKWFDGVVNQLKNIKI
jgi:hypothetical protein